MNAPSASEAKKWQTLQQAEMSDYRSALMQRQGHFLSQLCMGNQQRTAELAMCMARDCIAYESDIGRVGHEDLDNPDSIWRRGIDDCDGKARLFVALCKAADVHAKLVPLWKPEDLPPHNLWLSHVSAAVEIGGRWQPVELTLKRARVGEAPGEVPKEQDGKWLR